MRNVSSPESWAYLSRVVEGPSIHIQEFIANGRSADEIAHGVRTRASWIGALGTADAKPLYLGPTCAGSRAC